jgi:hypothetical protein
MSNCDFVTRGSLGGSLIDLVASRPALRAPALSAAKLQTTIQNGCGLPVATGAVL